LPVTADFSHQGTRTSQSSITALPVLSQVQLLGQKTRNKPEKRTKPSAISCDLSTHNSRPSGLNATVRIDNGETMAWHVSIRLKNVPNAQLFFCLHGLCGCFYRAMPCIAWTMLSQDVYPSVCLSVCLSHAGILLKPFKISSNFFHPRVATSF